MLSAFTSSGSLVTGTPMWETSSPLLPALLLLSSCCRSFSCPLALLCFFPPTLVSLETSSLILDSHYFQWEFYVVYISSQVCTENKSSFRKDKKTPKCNETITKCNFILGMSEPRLQGSSWSVGSRREPPLSLSLSLEVKSCFFRFISVLNTGGKGLMLLKAPSSKAQAHG